MPNYFEGQAELKRKLQPYYREKTNLRLKYAALISIGIAIILLLIMAFGVSGLSISAVIYMRIFAGVFALIFALLYVIIVYRVHTAYFRDKARPGHTG